MALRESSVDLAKQNSPVNLYNQTPSYSPYQSAFNSAGTPVFTTPLLAPDIDPKIRPQWPAQFTDMAFFMSLPKKAVKGLEYSWAEEPWIVNPIGVRAVVGTTAAVPNVVGTQVVPITDATVPYVSIGDKVSYNLANGTVAQGVVSAKTPTAGAATITVNTMEGASLPALVAGDQLQNHGPITADGYSTTHSSTHTEVIMYSNLLEKAGRHAQRWDPMQLQQYRNLGTTDYVDRDRTSTYVRLMVNLQARLMLSRYGRGLLPDGVSYTTTTSGLLEQMSNGGVVMQSVPTAQAVDAIRQTVFDTSLTSGGTKVILGTRETLHLMGIGEKATKVRYNPNDTTWNMDISQYEFFGHQCILVPMDQWKDVATYGPLMQKKILVLNKEDLEMNFMEGVPMISRKFTLINQQNSNPSTGLDIDMMWWEAVFGLTVHKAFATGHIQLV